MKHLMDRSPYAFILFRKPCELRRPIRISVMVKLSLINPQAPVAQKISDELLFRRFQVEEVEFFLIGPH